MSDSGKAFVGIVMLTIPVLLGIVLVGGGLWLSLWPAMEVQNLLYRLSDGELDLMGGVVAGGGGTLLVMALIAFLMSK